MPDRMQASEDEEEVAGINNALKAVSETEDELRVANYIVLFGGRDLEGLASPRKNGDGSRGEFFTETTELESAYTKSGMLYVDWEHGIGKELDGDDAPGRHDVLGYVDWKTAKADGNGVWVERALNRRLRYVQFLEALVREGLIGTSSEAIQENVEVKANGEIAKWPLRRDSLTVRPMEPRNISENALRAFKALADEFPNIKALSDHEYPDLQADEPQADATQAPAATAAAGGVTVNILVESGGDKTKATNTPEIKAIENANTEVLQMSENQEIVQPQTEPAPVVDVAAIARQAAAEAVKAYQDALEAATPIKSPGVIVTGDSADRALAGNPFKSAGEFFLAVASGSQVGGHVDERLFPLRGGQDVENGFDMTKALGPGYVGSLYNGSRTKGSSGISGLGERVPSDGGFLVGVDRGGLLERAYATGDILQRVDMMPISAGSNGMTLYAEDETSRATGSRRGGIRGYWAAEGATVTASKPKFREMNLKLRKLMALVYATDELLGDAAALEAYILRNVPEELRFLTEDAVFNGTGSGQPAGILSSTSLIEVAAETSQAANTIVAENIINMWAQLWAPARRNAAWFIDQTCEPQLYTMALSVGTGGAPVYLPPGGLSGAPYATLMGRPVFAHEYGVAVGEPGDILLLDLGEYQMIEKGGVESASSMHVLFLYDEQCFRFVYRVDGQSKWNSTLTPKSGGSAQSPFIALASR